MKHPPPPPHPPPSPHQCHTSSSLLLVVLVGHLTQLPPKQKKKRCAVPWPVSCRQPKAIKWPKITLGKKIGTILARRDSCSLGKAAVGEICRWQAEGSAEREEEESLSLLRSLARWGRKRDRLVGRRCIIRSHLSRVLVSDCPSRSSWVRLFGDEV